MSDILKKNNWKILSFALAGFIVLGALVPQANAATDISQIIQKIYNIVASLTMEIKQ